jgi:hypothetical protein
MTALATILVLALTLSATLAPTGDPTTHASLGVDSAGLPHAVESGPEVRGPEFRDGPIFVSGQPSGQAFARFTALGVSAVVYLGMNLQAVMARGEALAMTPPLLQGLVGQPVTLPWKET